MLGTSQQKALKGYNLFQKKTTIHEEREWKNDNRFTWRGLPAWTEKKVACFRDH